MFPQLEGKEVGICFRPGPVAPQQLVELKCEERGRTGLEHKGTDKKRHCHSSPLMDTLVHDSIQIVALM